MIKKICHINLAKGFRGGERQTLLLLEGLAKLGLHQTLVVRENSQLLPRTTHIPNLKKIIIKKPYILHLSKLKKSDLIHAHETKALQLAYFAKLFFNIPYIVTRRVDNTIKNNFFNKKLYENAAVSVALSNAIAKTITAITSKAKITIIPSAYTDLQIDPKTLQQIQQRFDGKFLIGHIGALDDTHKGQSYIIEAAKQLQKSHPDIHFIFVGDGKDEEKLKTFAKGCGNITFIGFVENVADYIAALDLFVFPSNNEGLGSILLDVMRLDVPIIASKVGGIIDIIQNGKNGILIPPRNPFAIKNAILTLYNDPNLRKKLTINAKEDLSNFSATTMAKRYYELYENIL